MESTINKTRRIYKAVSKTGVTDTHSTVRAGREYNYAVIIERKAIKETRKIEVPSYRYIPCKESPNGLKQISHMCYRYETDFLDQADGRGEYVLSFHTTKALAQKALEAYTGKGIFNSYIVETVRVR